MKKILFFISILIASHSTFADGIMLPKDTAYPQTFLKNLVTEITVDIHGQMVETTVYQEFLNEWSNPVDAVWNFPMPADARSTKLTYWVNDTAYDAQLKVAQQVVNPGTGDGGIAAVVNQYIGKSGIKLELQNIPAHSVQKICFHYFSLLDYHMGEYEYKYPLNTSDFIQYYISYLKVNINIDSKSPITGFNLNDYENDVQVLYSDSNKLNLEMIKSKAYLAKDFEFNYKIIQDTLNVDSYSNYSDTMSSHFGFFIRPPIVELSNKILRKRIVFLVGNSSSMNGYKLQQSVAALCNAMDSLKPNDVFNIAVYNASVSFMNPSFMQVNTANIQSAKTYLQSITAQGGSDLNAGLSSTLAIFNDSNYQNCILGFSDGHSVIDPVSLAASNQYKTTICFIGIGSNIDRERLEMTAAYNYGFVSYADANDNIKETVLKVFDKINAPLIKNVNILFNKPDVAHVIPVPYPSINAGSSFYIAGRYDDATQNQISIYGEGILGYVNRYYTTTYSSDTANEFYVRYLWAKEKMDDLERRILIYGEDSALKDSLIAISLGYKMKCRYTAYFQMEENIGGDPVGIPVIAGNETKINCISIMPNPFGDIIHLSVTIPQNMQDRTKLIKIFSPLGTLLKVIDISDYDEGTHYVEIEFSGMPKGVYYIVYQENNSIASSLKVLHY
jgi:Ca-activated chloride channel homolog